LAEVYFNESFETALVFDAKPFQGTVPICSPCDCNNVHPYPNLLNPLEWTGSADQTGHKCSSFHINGALTEEGTENTNQLKEGQGENDEDQLEEESADEEDVEDDEGTNEHTGDNQNREEDYGVIPPPFPEQYQTRSL
jgi:hypothetical protein